MDDPTQDVEEEELLSTSTLRGILLLGGVASVAYIAFQFWMAQRAVDAVAPKQMNLIRVPISLPIAPLSPTRR